LTSARHDVFHHSLADEFPETYDSSLPKDLVYSGSKLLTDQIEGTPLDAGQLVLSPTRTYAPVIKAILDQYHDQIHGMVHCSGGAQTKILHFIEDLHIIKDNLFPKPPLFHMIQSESKTPWQEMYKVFNMGHRMEVYVPQELAANIIAISEQCGIAAQIVGRVEAAPAKMVTIRSEHGEFNYQG
ncbi:MAG: AIR synthase-related protein, partial [Sphingomonadales bacterium]